MLCLKRNQSAALFFQVEVVFSPFATVDWHIQEYLQCSTEDHVTWSTCHLYPLVNLEHFRNIYLKFTRKAKMQSRAKRKHRCTKHAPKMETDLCLFHLSWEFSILGPGAHRTQIKENESPVRLDYKQYCIFPYTAC